MGQGAMTSAPKKIGVTTVSSTETEVASDRERFTKFSWFRYFRLAQCDDTKEIVMMQDNESVILLHKRCAFVEVKGRNHIHV